ncbi:MAG: hypothetical protein ACSHXD_05380 [Marinosulfonomonas sp.]
MLKKTLTAAVIATGLMYPTIGYSKAITCALEGHHLTGNFKGGGDTQRYVEQILGYAFRVDPANPNVVLMAYKDGWYKAEGVKISKTKNFTLYKHREGSLNFRFRVYNDGRAIAGAQRTPVDKYVYMEAKGKCDNV